MTSATAAIDGLVQRLRGGDPRALAELFTHYRELENKVLAAAYRPGK